MTTVEKRGLTRDQHVELGEKILGAEAALLDAWTEITRAYPVNGKEQRAAHKAYRAVEALRVRMDGTEATDNPEEYTGSYVRTAAR